MQLAFESQALRAICENERVAVENLGIEVAEALKKRLSDLRAAGSLTDLVAGSPRLLEGGSRLTLLLANNQKILLVPNHRKAPTAPDGSLDWTRVSRLRLIQIGVET